MNIDPYKWKDKAMKRYKVYEMFKENYKGDTLKQEKIDMRAELQWKYGEVRVEE